MATKFPFLPRPLLPTGFLETATPARAVFSCLLQARTCPAWAGIQSPATSSQQPLAVRWRLLPGHGGMAGERCCRQQGLGAAPRAVRGVDASPGWGVERQVG